MTDLDECEAAEDARCQCDLCEAGKIPDMNDTPTVPLLLALARKHPRGAQIVEYAEHLRKNEGASTHAAIAAATLLATALYGHEGQFAELDAVDHALGLIAPTPAERVEAIRELARLAGAERASDEELAKVYDMLAAYGADKGPLRERLQVALATAGRDDGRRVAEQRALAFEARWRLFVEEVRSPLLELARSVGSGFDALRPYDRAAMMSFFEKVNGALRGGDRVRLEERVHFLEEELTKMSEAAQVAEKHAQEWQRKYDERGSAVAASVERALARAIVWLQEERTKVHSQVALPGAPCPECGALVGASHREDCPLRRL